MTGLDACDDLSFGHDRLYMDCIFYLYVGNMFDHFGTIVGHSSHIQKKVFRKVRER